MVDGMRPALCHSGAMTEPSTQQRAGEEEEVTDALLALSRVLVGIAARTLASLDEDVTLPQYRMLILLASRGPQRAVDLADELDVTASTATRMCDRLVRKGLAARHVRSDDRRAAWVGLTPPGRDLVGEVLGRRREAIAALVRELSLAHPLAFASVVNALVQAAGEVRDAEWWEQWAHAVPNQGFAPDRSQKNVQH
jgi:DNA-binding MarR family transcriptional regulator